MAARCAVNTSEAFGLLSAGEPVLDLLDNIPLREFSPEQILNRMFSTNSYLSPSQAVRDQASHNAAVAKNLRHIGEGQCGTVYSIAVPNNLQLALKIAKAGKAEQLWQDYIIHRDIEDIWVIFLPASGLTSTSPKPSDGSSHLVSKRIYPLPGPLREALFRYFAPPQHKLEASRTAQLAQDKNKDCLVRVYLSRRMNRRPSPNFKLRNFDLTINEMEDLRLEPEPFATTMAKTLAMLHWGVGVDANDVEFVLGSAPMMKQPPARSELRSMRLDDPRYRNPILDFDRRQIGLWLLDFNQCATFKHDERGLKLVDGFWWNDTYYPRPGSKHKRDKQLWAKFKEGYLAASEQYIRGIRESLAAQFIAEVEKRSDKQSQSLFN